MSEILTGEPYYIDPAYMLIGSLLFYLIVSHFAMKSHKAKLEAAAVKAERKRLRRLEKEQQVGVVQ